MNPTLPRTEKLTGSKTRSHPREADRVEDEESPDSESEPENKEVKGRHAYNLRDGAEWRRNYMFCCMKCMLS